MSDIGRAIDGLFYAFFIAIAAAVLLAGYVFWSALWGQSDWEHCRQFKADEMKVVCMEAMQ